MTTTQVAKDVLSTIQDWYSIGSNIEADRKMLEYLEQKIQSVILAEREKYQALEKEHLRIINDAHDLSRWLSSLACPLDAGDNESVFELALRHLKAIPENILAEREACAKIADSQTRISEVLQHKAQTIDEASGWNNVKLLAVLISSQIRARSNAPEMPNKAPESPKIEYEGQDIPYSKLIAPDPISA